MRFPRSGQTSFPKRLTAGFLVGLACLLPGVSGGTLAASLGYYEPAVAAISGFLRARRQSFLYLLPLGLGGCAGVLVSALLLSRWMESAQTQVVCVFLGMVGGSLPSLWKSAHPDTPRPRHCLLSLLGIGVTLLLFLLERGAVEKAALPMGPLQAVLAGVIVAAGTVVPGVSGSFVLLYLGWYTPLMRALASMELRLVAPVCVGFGLAALLLFRAMDGLFRRWRRETLSVVLGFVVSSMALVFPGDFFGPRWPVNLALTAAGVAVGYAMGRMEKK